MRNQRHGNVGRILSPVSLSQSDGFGVAKADCEMQNGQQVGYSSCPVMGQDSIVDVLGPKARDPLHYIHGLKKLLKIKQADMPGMALPKGKFQGLSSGAVAAARFEVNQVNRNHQRCM